MHVVRSSKYSPVSRSSFKQLATNSDLMDPDANWPWDSWHYWYPSYPQAYPEASSTAQICVQAGSPGSCEDSTPVSVTAHATGSASSSRKNAFSSGKTSRGQVRFFSDNLVGVWKLKTRKCGNGNGSPRVNIHVWCKYTVHQGEASLLERGRGGASLSKLLLKQ